MSSCSFSRRHPHSLIPIAAHNASLVHLLSSRITREMVDYVARHAAKCVYMHPAYSLPAQQAPGLHSLSHFIIQIVKTTNISTATLLSCLIYFDRIRAKMTALHHVSSSAMHRVFLATIIVTAKYLNDSAPKNAHWASFVKDTLPWKIEEINTMERDLLFLLDFDLRFTEEEACLHFAPFMTTLAHQASTRASAVDKVSRASRMRAAQQTPSPTQTTPSAFASSVSKLAKRISMAHIRSDTSSTSGSTFSATLSPMPAPMRSNSSSTCSSEAGSLIDDTGSSSGSSSGWTSSESDSETEDSVEPHIYSSTSTDCYSIRQDLAPPRPKKPFILRPTGLPRNPHGAPTRARQPSDASTCTITAHSPALATTCHSPLNSFHSRRSASKRAISGSFPGPMKDGMISSSVTMPALPREGSSGGFLSRMWGAAKGQAMGHEKSVSMDAANAAGQGTSTLKRLVLVSSRSTGARNGGVYNV